MHKTRFTLGDLLMWVTLAGMAAALLGPMFGGRGTSLVSRLAISADGSTAAALFGDGTIRVWKTSDGRLVATLNTQTDDGFGFALSADGTVIARSHSLAIAPGFGIELWDVGMGKLWRTLPAAPGAEVVFAPSGGLLAATAPSGAVEIYEPPLGDSPAVVLRLPVAGRPPDFWGSPVFSPDGQLLAARSGQGKIVVFETATRKVQATFDVGDSFMGSPAFSPDGRKLVAPQDIVYSEFEAPTKNAGAVWDFSAAEKRRLSAKTIDLWAPISTAYLSDGRTIVVVEHGRLLFVDTLTSDSREVRATTYFAAASNRGDVLVTSDINGVDLWDTGTATLRHKLWTGSTGISTAALVAAFVVWLAIYNFRKVRRQLRFCHTCGRAYAPNNKQDKNVECENCRQRAQLRTMTASQIRREPWKRALRRFGGVAPVLLMLFWFWDALSVDLAWFLLVPAVLPAWIGLGRLTSYIKRRRTVNERYDLRLAEECAAACGEVRRAGGMVVWSAAPSKLADMLDAQTGVCLRRLESLLARKVLLPDAGRALIFADRRGLARYMAALRLPLASGPRFNGMYLFAPLKKLVLAEGELLEQTADPPVRLCVLILYRLLESCDPSFRRGWFNNGLASALARDDGDKELVRLQRRTKAALLANRGIGAVEFFQPNTEKMLRRLRRRLNDQVLHAWILQYQTQSWSVVEFLGGRGSTPERRAALQRFWDDPRRRRTPRESVSRSYGVSLDDLLQQWRSWVEGQPVGDHEPPPAHLAAWMLREPIATAANPIALRRNRIVAIRHLGELGFALGADRMIDVLRGDDDLLRSEAVWALECISGEVRGAAPDAWQAWWEGLPEVVRGQDPPSDRAHE